jgi:hypothetical protein
MIGVGVQVVVFLAVLAAILIAAGFLLGASWQWNRTGGVEDSRLTAAGLHAHCEALEAQNATLIKRNDEMVRGQSWRTTPH